jgi:hypothetical protein
MNNLRHTGRDAVKHAEDLRVHIVGKHTPVSQPITHLLQK